MKEKRAKFGFIILLLFTMCLVVQPVLAGGPATLIPGEAPAVQLERSFAQASSYPVTPHSIVPEVTEVGKISMSVNGLGVYPGNTGTITIIKPAGATVRKAYMTAATTGYSWYKLTAGDIEIDGTPVTWQIADFPSNINSYNYMGDVTSLVKSKIDSASPGNVDFTITEGNTTNIDGEILAVIFDDPAQTTDNTVVLLFGAQKTNGDDFNIGLATPLDLTDPNLALDFSLGISFSYQIGANQASNVDVNGMRLTSSAGGEDDGCHDNGCLLTVGGVGDTTANPANPLATPVPFGNWRYDDELYSLLPFVATGDTLIKVHTLNPSNNDNIFFAALNLRSATAVVGEGIVLSPASATNPIGTSHTVTAKVQDDNGNPVVGKLVTFEVTAGPNMGATGNGVTDSNGQVTFSYTGNVAGTDTIIASFVDDSGKIIPSNQATKQWDLTVPIPTPEFPTIALPMGMLMGIVFIIHVIRRRD